MNPPHLLLAPDSFKGALTAMQACAAMQASIRRAAHCAGAHSLDVQITSVPLADGGEGTVEAFHQGAGGTLQKAQVRGPLSEVVDAFWLRLPDGRAVIEMAQSSGLTLVPESRRDALRATSFGLGETVRAALDSGCRELLIGVGGSATTDGGSGALQALGARFLDAQSNEIPSGGGALLQLARIDVSQIDPRLSRTKIRVLCDVTNPLCGENGAAQVFSPQKGALPQDVRALDDALSHFADVASDAFASTFKASSLDLRDVPGAGAAGGAAFGVMRFCGAELVPGIDAVLEATHFLEKLETADLVLTGEGSIDAQTPHGKALAGVARAAKGAKNGRGVPVVALGGRISLSGDELQKMGIRAAFPICDGPLSRAESIARAAELLESATERVVRLWLAARDFSPPNR